MDFDSASKYWIEKDRDGKKLSREVLLPRIEAFIKSHNTLALATGYQDEVRCTPVEYFYHDGKFYIFSEGGIKFRYLKDNLNVSASVFDSYTGFSSIHSLQMQAKVTVVEEEKELYEILALKGISPAVFSKLSVHLLRLDVTSYDFLDSDLKKEGYSNRQHLDF